MSDDPTRFVTHSEFQTFRDDFRKFQSDVGQTLDSLRNMLSEKSKTNWSLVSSGLGTLLVITGMAAALVAFVIASEADTRKMSDQYMNEIIDLKASRMEGDIVENAHENDLMWEILFDQLERNGREEAILESLSAHIAKELEKQAKLTEDKEE